MVEVGGGESAGGSAAAVAIDADASAVAAAVAAPQQQQQQEQQRALAVRVVQKPQDGSADALLDVVLMPSYVYYSGELTVPKTLALT